MPGKLLGLGVEEGGEGLPVVREAPRIVLGAGRGFFRTQLV